MQNRNEANPERFTQEVGGKHENTKNKMHQAFFIKGKYKYKAEAIAM